MVFERKLSSRRTETPSMKTESIAGPDKSSKDPKTSIRFGILLALLGFGAAKLSSYLFLLSWNLAWRAQVGEWLARRGAAGPIIALWSMIWFQLPDLISVAPLGLIIGYFFDRKWDITVTICGAAFFLGEDIWLLFVDRRSWATMY